jgi:hypothetical protein
MRIAKWQVRVGQVCLVATVGLMAGACDRDPFELRKVPTVDEYCLAAQRVVTRTEIPMDLVVHESFEAFVKSKAIIDESDDVARPIIQQFNWTDDEDHLLGISCKLKSADHLNLVFGEGSAGPDGLCQEMNQAVFKLVAKKSGSPTFSRVSFDPAETVGNAEQPGMTGPDWLAPFTLTYVEDDVLHIATKGFIVEFSDPRYQKAPERFRGVHYCHLIAPDYLAALMTGDAPVGAIVGREVTLSGPPPHAE